MEHLKSTEQIRIDKWLWAARFFKTRSLAAEAVDGGKVHLNGNRTKSSHIIRGGDELKIRRGPYEWVVVVQALSAHRGPRQKLSSYMRRRKIVRRIRNSRRATPPSGTTRAWVKVPA